METTEVRRFADLTEDEIDSLIVAALDQLACEHPELYKFPDCDFYELTLEYDPYIQLTPEEIAEIRNDKAPLTAYNTIMYNQYSTAIDCAEDDLYIYVWEFIEKQGIEIDPHVPTDHVYPCERLFPAITEKVYIDPPEEPYWSQVGLS